jgi:hypothetical protein
MEKESGLGAGREARATAGETPALQSGTGTRLGRPFFPFFLS